MSELGFDFDDLNGAALGGAFDGITEAGLDLRLEGRLFVAIFIPDAVLAHLAADGAALGLDAENIRAFGFASAAHDASFFDPDAFDGHVLLLFGIPRSGKPM